MTTTGDALARDRALAEEFKGKAKEAVAEGQAETAVAEGDSVDALLSNVIVIKGGRKEFHLPRVTARTLYLLGKINSPMVVAKDPSEVEGDGGVQEMEIEEIFEALYILMKQDDPRILDTLCDPAAFARVMFQFTGMIDVADIPNIAAAISEQMAGVNSALKQEGLEGDSGNA